MADNIENTYKQRSAGQAAHRHEIFTKGIIFLMVLVMLGVTVWLIRLSNETQDEIFNEDPATLNIPITTSATKTVTRKKPVVAPVTPIPTRSRRPKGAKPRELTETVEVDSLNNQPVKLPPGTVTL